MVSFLVLLPVNKSKFLLGLLFAVCRTRFFHLAQAESQAQKKVSQNDGRTTHTSKPLFFGRKLQL